MISTTARNVVEHLEEEGGFDRMVAALVTTGVGEVLEGPGPFTLFAPTDAAFEALEPGAVDWLVTHPGKLAEIMEYHIVPGRLLAEDFRDHGMLPTLEGEPLRVRSAGGHTHVGGATVFDVDNESGNGVVHVIDRVLVP